MDRRKFSFSLIATAVLAGCGGGGGGSGDEPAAGGPVEPVVPATGLTAPGPELASATALPASTVFAQTLATTDTDGNQVAPGQANRFELATDFNLIDGNDDQFDGALVLTVGVAGTSYAFPSDQLYSELTALGPELTAADGVQTVGFTTDPAWVVSGTCSALMYGGPDVRLQQTLDLTSAAGNGVNLTWAGTPQASTYAFSDEPFYMQVVLRDPAGTVVSTLYRQDRNGSSGTWGSTSLTAFAGQVVVLSFEQCAPSGNSVIDDVSVVDATTGTEFVTNGDFEAGAAGWTVPAMRVSRNIRTGERSVPGLGTVQRTFFSQPNALWARMTDVFTNTSTAAIQASVGYATNLGSDGAGIIYDTPGAVGKALTTWDGDLSDRDIGFVFGAATGVSYVSASAIRAGDGNDNVQVGFTIDVPAGGSVTLINFVILSGADTGGTAVDATARATEVDTLAADIANNFRTNFAYQRGLTQAQLDTLKNF
jgi:hypothetical protein